MVPLAQQLLHAEQSAIPISDCSAFDALSRADAVEVQSAVLHERVCHEHATLVGARVFCDERKGDPSAMAFGFLTTAALHPVDAPLPIRDLIAPRAAPGIVFRLASDLGAADASIPGVIAATAGVAPAIDIA